MMNYRELIAWQRAMDLAVECHRIVGHFRLDQIRLGDELFFQQPQAQRGIFSHRKRMPRRHRHPIGTVVTALDDASACFSRSSRLGWQSQKGDATWPPSIRSIYSMFAVC